MLAVAGADLSDGLTISQADAGLDKSIYWRWTRGTEACGDPAISSSRFIIFTSLHVDWKPQVGAAMFCRQRQKILKLVATRPLTRVSKRRCSGLLNFAVWRWLSVQTTAAGRESKGLFTPSLPDCNRA